MDAISQVKNLLSGIKKQEQEDGEILHLTAYDNCLSLTARSLLSSALSQRYHLGTLNDRNFSDPAAMGEFLFKGMVHVDHFEKIAMEFACEMFFANSVDFRPLSGMHAMLCSAITLTRPQDTIYSIECDHGGHFGTAFIVKNLQRIPAVLPINLKNLSIDLDAFAQIHKKNPANIVYLDVGCALFPLPVKEIRKIVGETAVIIYDASHTYGLIAGGQFQAPLKEGADILQGNTHKTFPGPQKGMICFKDAALAQQASAGISSGLVSSQHTHHSLALYLTILEIKKYGEAYAQQMIKNAQCLAGHLNKMGIELIGADLGYTQSNILLIKGNSVNGHVAACKKLYAAHIATNSRSGYGEQIIRLGVQEVTRRGMKEPDMETIADFFKKIIKDNADPAQIKPEVIEFNRQFTQIHYSFDQELA